MAFIPPVSPGHVDPESERYNIRSRIQANSMWAELLGLLVRPLRRSLHAWQSRRDSYRW